MTEFSTDSSQLKKCPFCAELIQAEAIVCRHCGRTLTTAPTYFQPQKKDYSGLAITSLAMGIFSCLAWLFPLCGLPVSALALIFGIVGINSSKRNLAIAGIVTSAIGLILTIINSLIGAYLGYTRQL